MKEYGGYFQLDLPNGKEYYSDFIALNTGRNALKYLIEARDIRKIHLPVFLCSAVRQACAEMQIEIEYYTIDEHLRPQLEDIQINDKKNEYIYIVNYYGQISRTEILKWKKKYENIILDCAQDFFFVPIEDVDTLYTCRKYFGVTDGAYLHTKVSLKRELEVDYSYDRVQYLIGRYEKSASEFYSTYLSNESLIEKLPLKAMSKLTHGLLKLVNYDEIILQRNRNAEYLHRRLRDSNGLNIKVRNGMYMYPYKCKDGDNLRTVLQQKKIYIPTLWKDTFDIRDTIVEKELVLDILPIPLDQRYSVEDMKMICDIIEKNRAI